MKTTKNTIEEMKNSLTIGQLKAIALLKYQNEDLTAIDINDVEELDGDEERDGYIVLTDAEADDKATEYITESLWAFNASFLSSFTGIDIEVFEAIHNNNRCESNNKAIASMIDDIDQFVIEAVSADGRGHYINSYDGAEAEEYINGQFFTSTEYLKDA